MSLTKDVLFPIAAAVVGALAGAYATHLATRAQQNSARAELERSGRIAFFEQLKFHLGASLAAFNNQVIARDRLVILLEKNHGPLPADQYEPLFRRYYDVLNEDERVLFQLIRGITMSALYQHNEAMSKLLRENVKYSGELPEFDALREHLDLWLSKYSAMKDREDTCLVYIGVEEKKPFPKSVDSSVDRILMDGSRRREK